MELFQSRPTRACGLKPVACLRLRDAQIVTPHTGVWIETSFSASQIVNALRHAPHGRVD